MICPWNNKNGRILGGHCPIMWHTLYPYFFGALFGAKYGYNESGDCQVCCPAEFGVDTIVKVKPNDGKFPGWVPANWKNVIHAEVVKVNGFCSYDYQVDERIVFPTCLKKRFRCPAGIHNMFPFLNIRVPKCINPKRVRCPDWKENVYFSVEKKEYA